MLSAQIGYVASHSLIANVSLQGTSESVRDREGTLGK